MDRRVWQVARMALTLPKCNFRLSPDLKIIQATGKQQRYFVMNFYQEFSNVCETTRESLLCIFHQGNTLTSSCWRGSSRGHGPSIYHDSGLRAICSGNGLQRYLEYAVIKLCSIRHGVSWEPESALGSFSEHAESSFSHNCANNLILSRT